MYSLWGARMRIHIPNDDEADDIREKISWHQIGVDLRAWLEKKLGIEVDDELVDALMMHFEACKLAGIEHIDLQQAIDFHIKWKENSS